MANMDYIVEYDKSNAMSIEAYSQRMVGKTFRQIMEEDEIRQLMMVPKSSAPYGSSDVSEEKRNKGNLGQIIEKKFFHYACNSDSCADFMRQVLN